MPGTGKTLFIRHSPCPQRAHSLARQKHWGRTGMSKGKHITWVCPAQKASSRSCGYVPGGQGLAQVSSSQISRSLGSISTREVGAVAGWTPASQIDGMNQRTLGSGTRPFGASEWKMRTSKIQPDCNYCIILWLAMFKSARRIMVGGFILIQKWFTWCQERLSSSPLDDWWKTSIATSAHF